MHARLRNVRHNAHQHYGRESTALPGPFDRGLARHGNVDSEIGKPPLEFLQFRAKNNVAFGLHGINEMYLAWPGDVGEIANLGHERRNADATGDHHNSLGFRAGKGKSTGWSAHVERRSLAHNVVKISRYATLLFALDRQLTVSGSRGRRCNGVRTAHVATVQVETQRQELSR